MNIAVVDDELIYREQLERILKQELPKIGIRDFLIFQYGSAEEFLLSWKPNVFQLLFFDIYMSGMTGIELAQKIRETDDEALLIFSTTSNEFAAESFEVSASYYLRKDYADEAVAKVLRRLDLVKKVQQKKINFLDGFYCDLAAITYTTYNNHRVTLQLADGTEHTVRMSQSDLGELLLVHKDFCQINQGIVINFNYVEKMEKNLVMMKDKEMFPISRSNQKKTAMAYAEFSFRQMRKLALK